MMTMLEDERAALTCWSRFGSDSYPVRKIVDKWIWQYRSLKSGTCYKTKREAVASWEAFINTMIQRSK